MNLNQAQPSAFARSEGVYLSVIQNMAEIMKDNFEQQGTLLFTESKATASMAQATRDGANADAESMVSQATGQMIGGAVTTFGGVLSASDEAQNYFKGSGAKNVSAKIDTLQKNENLLTESEIASGKAVVARGAPDPLDEAAKARSFDRIKMAAQGDEALTESDITTLRTDPEKYEAVKARVKAQKERLTKLQDERDSGLSRRMGMFKMFGEGPAQIANAAYQTQAADHKRIQGQEQMQQMVYKYYGDTSKSMADMDGQASQALLSSRDAALQNLEAIVRSNQPN